MRYILIIVAIVLGAAYFYLGDKTQAAKIAGETMGTTYNVTVVGVLDDAKQEALHTAIEAKLAAVNKSMSNWDPTSEISTFNDNTSVGPVDISAEMAVVMAAAYDVHDKSGGKFDVTLAPLINLWGFGPATPESPVPADADIAAALSLVGQSTLLSIDADKSTMTKSRSGVSVNLSALAKGYGVDQVAAVVKEHGFTDYLVEIGGDLVTSGNNLSGNPWAIGIETPEPGGQTIEMILPVTDRGMATSGDYRNFTEENGVRYSHIIDPETGRPILHRTTSVTVLAADAMMADAWATALLVVGAETGLVIAEAEGLAAHFISRGTDEYVTASSSAFEKLRNPE